MYKVGDHVRIVGDLDGYGTFLGKTGTVYSVGTHVTLTLHDEPDGFYYDFDFREIEVYTP